MSRSDDVARLDSEILAAAEELGPRPTRREVADATGYSTGRVQQAYARQRAAEAEARGEPPPEKANTKPAPKPLLVVIEKLAVETWRVHLADKASGKASLPSAIRRAITPLNRRDGWIAELRQAVERALTPTPPAASLPDGEAPPPVDPVEELLDILDQLRAQAAAATRTDARQILAERLRALALLDRLRPAEQREGTVPASQITEAGLTGREKLRQLAARLERQLAEKVQRIVEEAARRGPEFYAGAVWALRQLGFLPKEGDTGDETLHDRD